MSALSVGQLWGLPISTSLATPCGTLKVATCRRTPKIAGASIGNPATFVHLSPCKKRLTGAAQFRVQPRLGKDPITPNRHD
jgi:hypothetical protein